MSNYASIYDDVIASVQKYALDKIADLLSISPGLRYLDWDTVSEVHELADNDLLGPAGMGITETSSNMFEIIMSFGVVTVNDPNLMRLRALASNLFADFRPGSIFPIYDRATAQVASWAVVEGGTTITPIVNSASRPRQFIQMRALLDPAVAQKV